MKLLTEKRLGKKFAWIVINLMIIAAIIDSLNCAPPAEASPAKAPPVKVSFEYTEDIVPVFAKFCEELGYPPVSVTLKNPTDKSKTVVLYAQVLGWSDPLIKHIDLKPNETKIEDFYLVFDEERMMLNTEKRRATLYLAVEENGMVVWERTEPIWIHARDDMIWSLRKPYDTTHLIAAWVTPRAPEVRDVLSWAKERMYDRVLMGDQPMLDKDRMFLELQAIYDTLAYDYKLSYVSVAVSYAPGASQRVSLPRDSLSRASYNCIDGSVLLASLAEALGYECYIVLVPGHALVAVASEHANAVYYIETTYIGRADFRSAVFSGYEQYQKYYRDFHLISIPEMRKLGITPLE